ncbi:MAG: flagellar biosynthetic protein FliO [Caulobacteraceae bacterium]
MITYTIYTVPAVLKSGIAMAPMVAGSAGIGDTVYGIFYFLFMSAVILGAAYYATKFIAKKGYGASNNKNLKVVEMVSLGIDKSLLLVKVGEQYLLLGSSQKNITLLTPVDSEKLNLSNANELYGSIGGENVEAYMNKLDDSGSNMNTIKQNLNKLKSIVRGNKLDG